MVTDPWQRPCPQYLHKPFQFLWWESDEISVSVIFMTIALLFDSKIWWLLSLVIPAIYIRFKKSAPRGFLKHNLYTAGLLRFKRYPDPIQTEYVE